MELSFIILQIGMAIALVVFAAERFICGAMAIAARLHWPDFISGVLLLAFGTSLPELVVAFVAVHRGHAILALGGVIGSNICNSLLVLGGVTLLAPIFLTALVRRQIIVQAVWLMLVTVAMTLWIFFAASLTRSLGIFLLIACGAYMLLLWKQMLEAKNPLSRQSSPASAISSSSTAPADSSSSALAISSSSTASADLSSSASAISSSSTAPADSSSSASAISSSSTQSFPSSHASGVAHSHLIQDPPPAMAIWKACLYWIGGLIVLLLAADWMLDRILILGHMTGVSDTVLGITVVGLGTSLPEFAASMVSATKGRGAMVVGNVLGSNCFNLLAVVAVPALLSPGPVNDALRRRDMPFLCVVTICLTLLMMWRRGGRVTQGHGLNQSQKQHQNQSQNQKQNQLSVSGLYIGQMLGGVLVAIYLGYLLYLVMV